MFYDESKQICAIRVCLKGVSMKRYVIPLISTGLLLISNFSYADENTGFRKILDVGCHLHDGTCFVVVDGAAIGGSYGCSSTQIRWDANTPVMGKHHLSMMLATMKASGLAYFNISGCYTQQAADGSTPWPTFNIAHYKN